jgi:hypothetical protein
MVTSTAREIEQLLDTFNGESIFARSLSKEGEI